MYERRNFDRIILISNLIAKKTFSLILGISTFMLFILFTFLCTRAVGKKAYPHSMEGQILTSYIYIYIIVNLNDLVIYNIIVKILKFFLL